MLTLQTLAVARLLDAVGPKAVSVIEKPRRDSGARYCDCGRRISQNKRLCLECAEKEPE
jgi:hypothetical protein